MDATWIITAFVLIDTLMERLDHRSDVRAHVPDSEVILIAVVAAKYFQNHHERAVCILRESGYLSGSIDVTRFNRRLHKLADWLAFIAPSLGEAGLQRGVFVLCRLPLPVWAPEGIPVSFQLVPAAFHDLTPLHELAVVLPPGARLFGDKAYNSALDEASTLAETDVRLIPA